jgi:hypothetical protein
VPGQPGNQIRQMAMAEEYVVSLMVSTAETVISWLVSVVDARLTRRQVQADTAAVTESEHSGRGCSPATPCNDSGRLKWLSDVMQTSPAQQAVRSAVHDIGSASASALTLVRDLQRRTWRQWALADPAGDGVLPGVKGSPIALVVTTAGADW